MKFVGIDIGSFSIKIAEIEAIGSSYQFNHFEEFPLPHIPGADPSVQIIETLRAISGRYDHSQTKFILGVRQEHISMRQREFPFRERLKILKSLPFDLEDELPFNQDDVVFDAKIQYFYGSTAHVQAVVCPKTEVQRILDICRDGYIDPDIISTEGIALGNLLENWLAAPPDLPTPIDMHASRRNAQLLLHLGHTRSLIAIYVGSQLINLRTIFWGGNDVVLALAKRFEVPYLEGEQALHQKGFVLLSTENANKDQIVFSETIISSIQPLLQEIKMTLLHIESTENLNIEQIDITGSVSKIRNLNAFLTQHLARRTNLLDPFDRFGQSRFAMTPEIAATAPIAFGLAAEGIKKPRNPALNLRRADLGKASDAFQKRWRKWRHAVILVASAYCAFFAYSLIRLSFISDLNQTSQQTLATIGNQTDGLKSKKMLDIRKFISSRQQQLRNKSVLERLQTIRSPLELVNKLSSVTPKKEQIKLDILELSLKDDSLSIKGSVADKNDLKSLEQAIATLATSKKGIQTEAPPTTVKTGTPFAFRLQVNRMGAKD